MHKKSRRFVNYKRTKLIGSSSPSFTRHAKNTCQSYTACIRSSHCFVGQKFGSSIDSTSEQRVMLCYFLKAMLLVQEKMCYVLDTFLPPCFFCFLPLGHERHKLLSLVPSLTQHLFETCQSLPNAMRKGTVVAFTLLHVKVSQNPYLWRTFADKNK